MKKYVLSLLLICSAQNSYPTAWSWFKSWFGKTPAAKSFTTDTAQGTTIDPKKIEIDLQGLKTLCNDIITAIDKIADKASPTESEQTELKNKIIALINGTELWQDTDSISTLLEKRIQTQANLISKDLKNATESGNQQFYASTLKDQEELTTQIDQLVAKLQELNPKSKEARLSQPKRKPKTRKKASQYPYNSSSSYSSLNNDDNDDIN